MKDTPVNPALWRLRQVEYHKLEAILIYTGNSRLTRAT